MKLLIDTREQKPVLKGKFITLTVGDYTTEKLFNKFHIERKSPQDLYGSIIQGHVRFRKMILRAKDRSIKMMIFVECSHKKFVGKLWPGGDRRKTKGETLEKIVDTIYWKYGIEFVWCSNRTDMKKRIVQQFKVQEKIRQ